MKNLRALTLIACLGLPLASFAKEISIAPGHFQVSDELVILAEGKDPSAIQGKTDGMIVFSPNGKKGGAVFVFTYVGEDPAKPPLEPLDAAVKIGNPFDKSLTSNDASAVLIGGATGATYSGILGSGLMAKSYVVANNGYRLVVLLKGPDTKPNRKLFEEFSKSLEQFVWKVEAK